MRRKNKQQQQAYCKHTDRYNCAGQLGTLEKADLPLPFCFYARNLGPLAHWNKGAFVVKQRHIQMNRGYYVISHLYLHNIPYISKLSCRSTYVNELVNFIAVGTVISLSSLIILVSYAMILSNIIRMSSGFSTAMVLTGLMIRLNFCDNNIINHYMCDIFPILLISCSDTYVNELVSTAVVGTAIILCCLIIFMSYALILFNIIQMSSGKGWSKALGTCGSHIITVSLFYGSGLLAYVKPSSAETVGQGKFFSVFYTFLVPVLNPLIYSLRNKDVQVAVKKTFKRITS
ncbi:hypothetical protein ACRRTK_003905 [Alexandromys fortis]